MQLIRNSRIALLAPLLLCLLLAPVVAGAQTTDVRVVEFRASADHDRVQNGRPVIDFYELEFYIAGAAGVLQRIDLGKPTPDADGMIRVDFSSRLASWPASGLAYEARVVAIGLGGYGASAPSNTFTFPNRPPPAPDMPDTPGQPQPCTYAITPSAQAIGAIAMTSTFSVSTGSGCTWRPQPSDSWLAATDSSTRTGNAMVTFRAAANTSALARVATMRVGTESFVLTQNGTCGFTVTPASQGFNPGGGTGTIVVTGAPACNWTAVRAGSWITITSGASGNGNGTVRFSVAANTGSESRTGTLTIAGQAISVIQSSSASPNAPGNLRVVIIR